MHLRTMENGPLRKKMKEKSELKRWSWKSETNINEKWYCGDFILASFTSNMCNSRFDDASSVTSERNDNQSN